MIYCGHDFMPPEIEYTGIVWRAVELLPYRTTDEQFVKTCHQFGGLALIDALERLLRDDWINPSA